MGFKEVKQLIREGTDVNAAGFMIYCVYFVKRSAILVIKTLTKHGNSLALILDKPILELLNIDIETPISISTDGKSLTLSPVFDEKRDEKLTKIRALVNKKYETTFRKLAD